MFHNVFSTIVAESPPVVWPLRPVLDDEYPAPTIRTEGLVPPAAHPRVVEMMREAAEFVRQWQARQSPAKTTRRANLKRSAEHSLVTAGRAEGGVASRLRRSRQGGAVGGLVSARAAGRHGAA